jgi:hypothetical protein
MTERVPGITENFRLRRHIGHEERSKAFRVATSGPAPRTVMYERFCPSFNQGNVGAGKAMAGPSKRAWCYQSWGANWGGLRNGTFWLSFESMTRLLRGQGDATLTSP